MKSLLPYITDRIQQSNARHETHSFHSGTVMIDIWIGEQFYVIQIDGDIIGLSLVTEETSFDIVPDYSFKDATAFKMAFENIFH